MAQIAPTSDLDFVDEFYFSALFDQDEEHIFPPFDGIYAQELQFQEALMSSSSSTIANPSQMTSNNSVDCNPFVSHASSPILVQSMPHPYLMETEAKGSSAAGESSLSFCEICVERKETDQMFNNGSCVHSYCSDCISKHVSTRLEATITIITCPGVNCRAVLELDACRPVLPEGVIHRWEDALCQEFINASKRFYCPLRDCSAPLLADYDNEEVIIRESECPSAIDCSVHSVMCPGIRGSDARTTRG